MFYSRTPPARGIFPSRWICRILSIIAIHTPIVGVLNMSGVGRFFNELLEKYKDGEGNVLAVRSWSKPEILTEAQLVSKSVIKGFRSVKVQ